MLSDAKIKAAKPREKPYKLTDSGGLHLYITPAGGRTWRWKYAIGGREKLLTIGRYPAFGLAAARKARDEARALLHDGKDPASAKRTRRLTLTATESHFEAVAREWHGKQRPQWTATHAGDVLRSLERDVFPDLGAEPIAEITPPMMHSCLQKVVGRGAIETAKRIRQRCSEVFVYGIATGRCENDPAAIVAKALPPVKKGRQPALTTLDGVQGALRDALRLEGQPTTKLALRLLALSHMRPGEVRHAQVDEFDDLEGDAPTWTVPAERMKMKRPFVVPLSREAADTVLAALRLAGDGPLLFPSPRRSYKPLSENAMGYMLNRSGYHGRHVPHGFRSSFSSIMNERHPDKRHIIDFMLSHAPADKIEGAYNRALYLDQRRELTEEWASLLLVDMPSAADLLTGPRRRQAVSS